MLKAFIATLALIGTLTLPALAEDIKLARTMTINGHGEVRFPPDMAIINLGVVSQAVTAKEALARNTADMNALFASLKAQGIADKDMQTAQFNVNPRVEYDRNGQNPKVVGYDVTNSVSVIVRKLDSLGALLDVSVSTGSNQINGITFTIDNTQSLSDEARQRAVKDARRKAELFAAAADVTLGNVVTIAEGGGYQPQPVVFQKTTRAESYDAGAPVPIAQGEQVMGADVSVVWEIK